MGAITVEKRDYLYWLGRYIERAYQSIRLYQIGFDRMIDADDGYYKTICDLLGIPDTYGSKEAFLSRYGFDREDCHSIMSSLTRAYDNAMVMRDEISTDTLAYVHLAQADMERARQSDSPLFSLQKVEDSILAFWGCLDDVEDDAIRNSVKAGKWIERIDIFLRLKRPRDELAREIGRLMKRIDSTTLKYDRAALMHAAAMIEETPIDYPALLQKISEVF